MADILSWIEEMMKYLCLAYGAEKDWNALSEEEQDTLLAQDEALRRRGVLMAAVQRAWQENQLLQRAPSPNPKCRWRGFASLRRLT